MTAPEGDTGNRVLQNRIAKKQRTTLMNGRNVADSLKDGPPFWFSTTSEVANRPNQVINRLWRTAFDFGKDDDPNGPKSKFHVGKLFRDMFNIKLELTNEEAWRPRKPLGAGSYGAAGLFTHTDDQGTNNDFVVAKYAEVREKDLFQPDLPEVSKEAALMFQLNELDNDGILFLRDFKHFRNDQRWLYLLEYCPNFNTETLRLTYKAMNRHIPEPLLWCMFHSLAKGLAAMEHGPFGQYRDPKDIVEGCFLIHRDIKPANTFLGYPPYEDVTNPDHPDYLASALNYPRGKIADFGMATLETLHDVNNTMDNHTRGSKLWYPPELRVQYIANRSNFFPFAGTVFHGSRVDKYRNSYTPAGNIFMVGFMMYQFLTLDEPDSLSKYLNRVMIEQEPQPQGSVLDWGLNDKRHNIIEQFISRRNSGYGLTDLELKEWQELRNTYKMLHRWKAAPYSPQLRQLIERCMVFLPEDRISARELLAIIEKSMPSIQKSLADMGQTQFDNFTTVFTTEIELNNMTLGNAHPEREENFWYRLVKSYQWIDTSVGMIQPVMDPNDPKIPREAHDFFAPSYRAAVNRQLTQQIKPTNIQYSAPSSLDHAAN